MGLTAELILGQHLWKLAAGECVLATLCPSALTRVQKTPLLFGPQYTAQPLTHPDHLSW